MENDDLVGRSLYPSSEALRCTVCVETQGSGESSFVGWLLPRGTLVGDLLVGVGVLSP